MKRNLIVIVLLLSVFVLGARAEVLELQKGWELTLENSSTHKLALIDLERAKIDYLRAEADNLLANLEANQKKAEDAFEKAEKNYNTAVQNLQITFLENYLSVTNLIKQLEIRQVKLAQAEAAYENGLKKWEIKSISDAELRNLKLALNTAKNNLINTQNQLELAKMDFASMTGNSEWEFDFDLVFVPFTETLDDLTLGLDKLEKVVQAKDQLETAISNLEDAKQKGEAALSIREKELEVEKAKLNLKNVEEDQLKQLIRGFNTLKQSENSYYSAKEAYENEIRKYEVAVKQKEAGVITKDDLDNSEIALKEQEMSLKESLLNYYKSLMNLEQLRGRGEFNLDAVIKNK